MLQLELRRFDPLPLEVEGCTPCRLKSLSMPEIEKLPVFCGREQLALADLFHVRGAASAETLVWSGDLRSVHRIGAGQSSGNTIVEGDCGRHTGSNLGGGEIEIRGNAGDWLGAEMRQGVIRLTGNAGDFTGAAYRGSPVGMSGGTILVRGNAGHETGHAMRRGLIAIGGEAGDLIGFHMLAGTILVCGRTGMRHGANMKRGTLIFAGPPPALLPTFRPACSFTPNVLRLLDGELARLQFPLSQSLAGRPFQLHHGDFLTGGRGEILLRA